MRAVAVSLFQGGKTEAQRGSEIYPHYTASEWWQLDSHLALTDSKAQVPWKEQHGIRLRLSPYSPVSRGHTGMVTYA